MRTVIAGIGNAFRRDDGFGPAVVAELRTRAVPDDTRLIDAGIRTMHLAYEIADGVDLFVIIDAVDHDDAVGTLVVLEPDFGAITPGASAHGIDLAGVADLALRLGSGPKRTLMIGCVPGSLSDGEGLTPAVAAAVEPAATLTLSSIANVVR